MDGRCKGFIVLASILLGSVGCGTTPSDRNLRPPPVPESYTLPPSSDPRFASPPEYPAEVMNEDRPRGLPVPGGPPPSTGVGNMSMPGQTSGLRRF